MNEWNDDLHHRQDVRDTGYAVLGSYDRAMTHRNRRRRLRLPLAVLILGLVLIYVGPLPGLGAFMVIGGALGTALTAVMLMLGPEEVPHVHIDLG